MCLGPSLTSNMLKTRLWNSSTKPVLLFHQHSRSFNASRSHLEPQGLTLCVINEQCPNRRYWNSSINDLISIIYTMWTTCHYSVIIIIISSKCHRILNPVKNWIETSSHRVKVRPFNYHKGSFQKYNWPSLWASKGNHPSSSLGITAPQSACCIWKTTESHRRSSCRLLREVFLNIIDQLYDCLTIGVRGTCQIQWRHNHTSSQHPTRNLQRFPLQKVYKQHFNHPWIALLFLSVSNSIVITSTHKYKLLNRHHLQLADT